MNMMWEADDYEPPPRRPRRRPPASAWSRWLAGWVPPRRREPVTQGWLWLSFADPRRPVGEQFLGVAIVAGTDAISGAVEAHRLGINPGGEVEAWQLPQGWLMRAEFTNRLITGDEAQRLGAEHPAPGELPSYVSGLDSGRR